jgi:2'-5' RNA ligase
MSDQSALKPEPLPETARVFFALWPDSTLQASLAKEAMCLHERLGGRRTRTETIHLTLLFVGAYPRAGLPELIAAARRLRVPDFELVFDEADCWRHNRIAFLGARESPQSLLDLVAGLEGVARGLGIAFDRRPYKPHITLLRHARCTQKSPAEGRAYVERIQIPAPAPQHWRAGAFTLMESRLDPSGASYTMLERFPLSQEDDVGQVTG